MSKQIKEVSGIGYFLTTVPNIYDEYSVELVLSDEDADDFESRGFPTINGTAEQKDGSPKTSKWYDERAITIKRKRLRKDGTPNVVPKMFDKNGEPIDVTAQNGSEMIVKYKEWETENQYGKFKGLDFVKVKITNLIEWNPDSEYDDDEFW